MHSECLPSGRYSLALARANSPLSSISPSRRLAGDGIQQPLLRRESRKGPRRSCCHLVFNGDAPSDLFSVTGTSLSLQAAEARGRWHPAAARPGAQGPGDRSSSDSTEADQLLIWSDFSVNFLVLYCEFGNQILCSVRVLSSAGKFSFKVLIIFLS